MVGLYVLAAVVVVLVAGPKRLTTTIPGRGIQRDLGAAESGTA
jgi:hypothetical protein